VAAAAAAHWAPLPPAHRVHAAIALQKTLSTLVLGGSGAFSGGTYPSLTADGLWATLLPTLTDPCVSSAGLSSKHSLVVVFLFPLFCIHFILQPPASTHPSPTRFSQPDLSRPLTRCSGLSAGGVYNDKRSTKVALSNVRRSISPSPRARQIRQGRASPGVPHRVNASEMRSPDAVCYQDSLPRVYKHVTIKAQRHSR
jgi:hypothetical protein